MRVVGEHCADPNDDGIHSGAQLLHVGTGVGRADPLARAVQRGRTSVHSGGELPDHEWSGVTGRGATGGGEPGQVARLYLGLAQPEFHVDPVRTQGRGAACGYRVRVDDTGHDPDHTRADQCLGAGTGSADVVTRLHRDHGGAAASPLSGGHERPHLGMRAAGVRSEALTDHGSRRVEDDAAHGGVGTGGAESKRRECDGTHHRSVFGRGSPSSPPRTAQKRRRIAPSGARGEERTCGGGAGPVGAAIAHTSRIDRALSPIRTVTVGLRFTLSPPVTGCHRVAGLPSPTIGLGAAHRRFGISPSPASALVGMTLSVPRAAATRTTSSTQPAEVLLTDLVRLCSHRPGSSPYGPVRRSTATYDPGWLLATVFISLASAISSRGSVYERRVDSATPTDTVTRPTSLTPSRRLFTLT